MMLPGPAYESKIVARSALPARAAQLARPIVFTNGVFDILHRGHVTYLARARALGASLVVAVNSDASARMLQKGPDRPLNGEHDRAAIIAALECVSLVTVFNEQVPLAVLEVIQPEVYVKGGDYDMKAIPETSLVESWDGCAVAITFEHERSTTKFLARLRGSR